jgi:hypothetical protein
LRFGIGALNRALLGSMPSDPPRKPFGSPPAISLDAPPPGWHPDEDDGDQPIGALIVVMWEQVGLTVRSKVVQSPPYRRRYWPWLKELFERIDAAERDRTLELAARPPKEPPKKK